MSVDRSDDLPVSYSTEIIRRAKKALETMPKAERIRIMVKAGVMTKKQAKKALAAGSD